MFDKDHKGHLLKIRFSWHKEQQSDLNLQEESLKILKDLRLGDFESLSTQLRSKRDLQLASGAKLKAISIIDLAQNMTVVL
jgi:hypothetical protein